MALIDVTTTFDVSGSNAQTTGTINAASADITLAPGHDFAVGHGVLVHGAGATCVLGVPAGLALTPGAFVPSDPHTYGYRVSAVDIRGGCSAACAEVVYAGNLTLGVHEGVIDVSWNLVANAKGYWVWRRIDGGAWAFVGNVTVPPGAPVGHYYDYGESAIRGPIAGIPTYRQESPPAAATEGVLFTHIIAGAGVAFTLNDAAVTSVVGAVVDHDDSLALATALASPESQVAGNIMYLPPGDYMIHENVLVVDHPTGLTIQGAQAGGTSIIWDNSTYVDDVMVAYRWGTLSIVRSSCTISYVTFQGQGGQPTALAHCGFAWSGQATSENNEVHHCTFRDHHGEACYCIGLDTQDVYWHDNLCLRARGPGFNVNNDVQGPHLVIEDNEVSGAGGFLLGGRSIRFRRNWCHDIGPVGGGIIDIAGCDDLIAEDNIVERCDISSTSDVLFFLGFVNVGLGFRVLGVVRDNIIRDNLIDGWDGFGSAMCIMDVVGPLTVENNTISNNGRVGDMAKQVFITGPSIEYVVFRENTIGSGLYSERAIVINANVPNDAHLRIADNIITGLSIDRHIVDLRDGWPPRSLYLYPLGVET